MQIKTRCAEPLWRPDCAGISRAVFCGLNRDAPHRSVVASMAKVHHETIFFAGRVQGVGFRYATLQVAKEFDVAGYVTNLADGRVQLEAEGNKNDVTAFVEALEERMHSYIRKTERNAGQRDAQFTGFAIK
jgi:acylphosphatase